LQISPHHRVRRPIAAHANRQAAALRASPHGGRRRLAQAGVIVRPSVKAGASGKLDLLPSPLWGGVGGGGPKIGAPMLPNAPPPSPALPHKGGGSTPSARPVLHHA